MVGEALKSAIDNARADPQADGAILASVCEGRAKERRFSAGFEIFMTVFSGWGVDELGFLFDEIFWVMFYVNLIYKWLL